MLFQPCSRCKAPCFDKVGPTSVRSSVRARKRKIIRSIETRHSNSITLPARLSVDGRTWFAPLQTSYQQPDAGDIAIFNTWRELTKSEGSGVGPCAGR